MRPPLGAECVQQLGLVKVQYDRLQAVKEELPSLNPLSDHDIYIKYHDVFEKEFGTLGDKLRLDLDETVKSTQLPVRRVPIAMRVGLKAELDRLEKRNVIGKIEKPTEWVSNVVIVQKPNGQV